MKFHTFLKFCALEGIAEQCSGNSVGLSIPCTLYSVLLSRYQSISFLSSQDLGRLNKVTPVSSFCVEVEFPEYPMKLMVSFALNYQAL